VPLLLLCSVIVCDVCLGLSAIYDDSRARYLLSARVSFIDAIGNPICVNLID
jgi:hypothetical protein